MFIGLKAYGRALEALISYDDGNWKGFQSLQTKVNFFLCFSLRQNHKQLEDKKGFQTLIPIYLPLDLVDSRLIPYPYCCNLQTNLINQKLR